MSDIGRDGASYHGWCSHVAFEAARSLQAADADGHPRGWWRGKVMHEHAQELRVGGHFTLADGHPNAPTKIGTYRIVAAAVAPEGYHQVVAFADPCVSNQCPIVGFDMLVRESE